MLLRIEPAGVSVERNWAAGGAARGATSSAIEGGGEIAQLVVGSDEPGEIVEAAGTALRGEAARLLPVLFPPQYPHMENQAL